MRVFPIPVLIGAAIVLLIWLATVAAAVASLWRRGRSALVLATVALAVSLLGTFVIKGQLNRSASTTSTLAGGRTVTRTSGWKLESRWFFAASGVVSLTALIVALRRSGFLGASPAPSTGDRNSVSDTARTPV